MSRTGSTIVCPLAWAALAQPLMKSCSSPRNSSGESLTLCLTRYPTFFFFYSNIYWKCLTELRRQKINGVPVSRALRPNLTRWIIYHFVTGHLFATPPQLLSSSIILFLTVLDWVHPMPKLEIRPFFCWPPVPLCVCVCRSMMLNFLKWPWHACVPLRGPFPLTLWMLVWEQHWRNRHPWMHRATLTPNPSTLPSE